MNLPLLALASLAAIAPAPDEGAELAPGVTLTKARMVDAPVHLIRIRPGAARWRFIRPEGANTARVEELQQTPGLLAAVNGGYFDLDGAPMGLRCHIPWPTTRSQNLARLIPRALMLSRSQAIRTPAHCD